MISKPSLLKNSWDEFQNLLSNRWQTFAWYIVMTYIVSSIGFFLLAWLLYPTIQSLISQIPSMMDSTFNPLLLKFPNFFAIGLIGIVIGLLTSLFTYGFYRVAVDKKCPQTMAEIFTRGQEKFWWTLIVSIASGIMVGVLVMMGFIALLIPGIYLAVILAFTFIVVVLEGKGPVEAMNASRILVRGRWWSVFGTLAFWVIVSGVIALVIGGLTDLFFVSVLHLETIQSLSNSLNESLPPAIMSGNYDTVYSIGSQILAQLMNTKTLLTFGINILIQYAFMIVGYYGILGTYLALKKTK